MKNAVKLGVKHLKPKKLKKKKLQEELDEEDIALKEIDNVRRAKQREFVRKQFRPEVKELSNFKDMQEHDIAINIRKDISSKALETINGIPVVIGKRYKIDG